MIEKIGTALFVLMIAFLAFVGGAMSILGQTFPYKFLRNAYRAGEALIIQRQIINDPLRTNLWQPSRTDARGVTVYDPAQASPGYTLYTSGDDNAARLIRGLYSMRVICFTIGRNEPLNSNKSVFETKIGDISTGKSDENRG